MKAGTNRELPAHALTNPLDVAVSHQQRPGLDLDIAVIAVGPNGLIRDEQDFVFFNNPTHPTGAVQHLGQRRHGDRVFDAARFNLTLAPLDITALHVTLSGEHDGFPNVPDLRVDVLDHTGSPIASIDLSNLASQAAAILLEIYRRSDTWKVRAVSQGWDAGFPALVEHYGIEVGEPEPGAAAAHFSNSTPAAPPTPPAPPAVPQPPHAPRPNQTPAWTPTPPPAPSTPPTPPPPSPVVPPGTAAPPAPAFPSPPPGGRRGLFGPRRRDLQQELDGMRAQVAALGGMDALAIARHTEQQRAELAAVQQELAAVRAELHTMRAEIVDTDEVHMLQAAGIYEFAHPLDTSVDYKERLRVLKDGYKALVRANRAVDATTNWQINGSMQQGSRMVKDTSKLMLRAYNAEADTCVRVIRPHSLDTNLQRLAKARDAISKLGAIMSIRITDEYHRLRCDEIRLTADYHAKVEQEREEQREARERAREDKVAQAEYERERQRLDRERAQVERALDVALTGTATDHAVAQLRERLAAVDAELEEAELRAANARLGFVYVISNIGAFGPDIVKIGMTRRREPMDRVRELGDASVPFLFDVHALVFSEDALGLEAQLHAAFAHRRVNRINRRREFFYATPEEVRFELQKLKDEHLLDFKETPLADEWRRSMVIAREAGELPAALAGAAHPIGARP